MVTRPLAVGEHFSGLRGRLRSIRTALRENPVVLAVRKVSCSVHHHWQAFCFTRRFYAQACRVEDPPVATERNVGAPDVTELLFQRSVPPRLHAIVQLRVASQVACIAETTARTELCRYTGWSDDQIRAALLGIPGDGFSEPEALALRYADEMTRTPIDVDPQTVRELRRYFSPADMTELTASIAHENLRCRFTDANSRIR